MSESVTDCPGCASRPIAGHLVTSRPHSTPTRQAYCLTCAFAQAFIEGGPGLMQKTICIKWEPLKWLAEAESAQAERNRELPETSTQNE